MTDGNDDDRPSGWTEEHQARLEASERAFALREADRQQRHQRQLAATRHDEAQERSMDALLNSGAQIRAEDEKAKQRASDTPYAQAQYDERYGFNKPPEQPDPGPAVPSFLTAEEQAASEHYQRNLAVQRGESDGTADDTKKAAAQSDEKLAEKESDKIQIKGVPRNYVEWASLSSAISHGEFASLFADGRGTKSLDEYHTIPDFFKRETDVCYEGTNNTLICLGRDRNPGDRSENWSPDSLSRSEKSGYSDHMGAGAIDIVVGRMSPFPLSDFGENKDIVLGPLYNTVSSERLKGRGLINGKHPGIMMDAARIYISQMTDVDDNFKLRPVTKEYFATEGISTWYGKSRIENDGAPASAIMLKADKLRMHARQNIKLVTRGNNETVNSQGNQINASNIGIHLMANNGKKLSNPDQDLPQHPMVLGTNLHAAIHNIVKLVEETTRILNSVITFQSAFNQVLATHHHETATGPALWNLMNAQQGIITQLEMLTKGNLQCTFNDMNLFAFKARFLNPGSDEYINSKFNTVN